MLDAENAHVEQNLKITAEQEEVLNQYNEKLIRTSIFRMYILVLAGPLTAGILSFVGAVLAYRLKPELIGTIWLSHSKKIITTSATFIGLEVLGLLLNDTKAVFPIMIISIVFVLIRTYRGMLKALRFRAF
ncbi:hypothetical protein HUO09_17375 [Vibrio sp. Y2-5]|uniref:hypothetical protein n=1 Tax=Vibrio sp. Y2-5 TaxID=2743977 RepID=UPI0016608C63|nr:hypothetical protein [Vibrio sp. Y2-5]MBD0788128.1 hypothetical protein [Vibrio sp. Y2-5]